MGELPNSLPEITSLNELNIEEPKHSKTKKASHAFKNAAIIFTAVLLAGVTVLVLINKPWEKKEDVPMEIVTPDYEVKEKSEHQEESQKTMSRKGFGLYIEKDGKKELVNDFGTDFDMDNPKVAKWANFLIFQGNEKEILIHDLNNGTTETLATRTDLGDFALSYDEQKFDETTFDSIGLYQIKVYENNLYLPYGAYMTSGVLFSFDLEKRSLSIVTTTQNPRLIEMGDKLWISGGEGDSCWSKSEYRQLDPSTNEMGGKVEFDSGCWEGETNLGYDQETEVFIISMYERDEGDEAQKTTRILELKTKSPGNTYGDLVDTYEMPQDITEVHFDEKWRKVYLSSLASLYVYDIPTGEFKKVGDYENAFESLLLEGTLEKGGLCIRAGGKYLVIDHTTAKTIDPDVTQCKNDQNNEESKETKTLELFDSFNLPSEYSYEFGTIEITY